ncbi:PocR ligand-binding domain-containing protein [Methanolobus mangrovi]|uniref:histidine kinase n=1 Tax=Methanolobus mangrovi TaxID=3072977 RepID=A0AA51YHH1_9EURY|nr:PocR ligand-binding domain-containing protein [Methanolobus mangrovi]WMW23147.1 PocR ligand-binding domain-containing protein [Methanolobus mangrovi]
MDYKFTDLVNIDELQELMHSFCEFSDLSFSLIDDNDNVLIASGWIGLCSKFHRTNPVTAKRCIESNGNIRSCMETKSNYYEYKCKNGLVNIAIPINVHGKHLATLIFSQFLFDEPDYDFFRKQAESIGFDVDSYLKALDEVPIFSKDKAWKVVRYCSKFTNLIVDVALLNSKQKMHEIRSNAHASELAANKEALSSLDNMKNELISTFSHELKTPLSIIKGYNELLYDGCLGPVDQRQKNALDSAILNINRLENIVDSLLYLGMEHLDEHFYDFLPLNISEVIESVAVKSARALKDKNLSLQTDIPQKVPMIHGDSKKLYQALFHLLDNAIKFSPQGSTIAISVTEADGRLYLSMKDNGIGIVEEQLSCIFEGFYQVDSSLTRKYPGVGLGLNICQRIIERHEGTIRVESKVNEGSTFHIGFPIKEHFANCMPPSN